MAKDKKINTKSSKAGDAKAKETKLSRPAPKKPASVKSVDPKAAAKKKAPVKKTAAKKKAPAKKVPAKKTAAPTAAKKPAAKKPAAKTVSPKTPLAQTIKAPAAPPRASAPGEPLRELPLEYDDTKVVLMVRDPEWLFAYWEISAATREQFDIPRGRHNKDLILRVFEFNGPGETAQYDVAVNDYTSSWYIRLKDPSSTAQVTLGFLDENGNLSEITSSNRVQVPRMGISDETDVEFAEVNDEIYDQIVQLSGGSQIGERLGSDEFLRSLQRRLYDSLLESSPSSGGMYGLSSGLWGGASDLFSGSLIPSSISMFSDQFLPDEESGVTPAAKGGGFWLEVGVDVIVYGATEPNAKVSFMGRDIQLAPDGTFRVRMVLPDTNIEFPVVATSFDGEETRKVKPVVQRTTEGDPRRPA